MKKFKLQIDEPKLLKLGEPGDQVWGHYQFPNLRLAYVFISIFMTGVHCLPVHFQKQNGC